MAVNGGFLIGWRNFNLLLLAENMQTNCFVSVSSIFSEHISGTLSQQREWRHPADKSACQHYHVKTFTFEKS